MDINGLRAFVSIIDEGSFAAAARRLGMSRSQSSKHIADLEAELGVRLLTRTTRVVRPTAIGQDYAERIRAVLRDLDGATEAVRAAAGHPVGTLRISAPTLYTLKVLQPHVLRFIETFPDIQLEMVLDDGLSDLVADGFDAIIRIGRLQDSTLHARRLHQARLAVVASPDYIERRGAPQEPADLARHDGLHYVNLPGSGTWPLMRGTDLVHQKIHTVFSSNSTELLFRMALNGRGIAMLPEFVIAEAAAEGKLQRLMTDLSWPEIPVSLIYPSNKLMTAAMRSFLDFFSQLRLD